ncbi:hypothetical protein PR202_gb27369 [Eleusine coracana subsp. coracana]|uniref:Uncharacterized protein n=1 Tax=Eleusine coracana subsp. coracana TaxID=191504 RepID=A0AAV5FRN3_ELECO|nr:hypothetical protein PR202_gb27369 [Eleusine coracana subsp. coracana]
MSTPDEQEILGLIKEMKKNASPGPDGLNVAFYRASWPWIKEDIMHLIRDFYDTGHIHPELNNTCIVLIPKKEAELFHLRFDPTPFIKSPRWATRSTGSTSPSAAAEHSTNKSSIQQIIITIWHLWKARNDKRFNRKNWTAMQVHWATKAVLKDAQVNDEPPIPLSLPPSSRDRNLTNRSARTTNPSTVPPLPCTSESMCRRTCFTDAALPLSHQVNMPNRARIGVFITVPGAACPTIAAMATAQHAASPLQAEAMAILLASKMLKALNFTEISMPQIAKYLPTLCNKMTLSYIQENGD